MESKEEVVADSSSSPDFQPSSTSIIDSLASHAINAVHSTAPHPNPSRSSFLFSSPAADDSAALAQQYAELMAQNDLLVKENRLFDSFIQRSAEGKGIEHDRSPKVRQRPHHRRNLSPLTSRLNSELRLRVFV